MQRLHLTKRCGTAWQHRTRKLPQLATRNRKVDNRRHFALAFPPKRSRASVGAGSSSNDPVSKPTMIAPDARRALPPMLQQLKHVLHRGAEGENAGETLSCIYTLYRTVTSFEVPQTADGQFTVENLYDFAKLALACPNLLCEGRQDAALNSLISCTRGNSAELPHKKIGTATFGGTATLEALPVQAAPAQPAHSTAEEPSNVHSYRCLPANQHCASCAIALRADGGCASTGAWRRLASRCWECASSGSSCAL